MINSAGYQLATGRTIRINGICDSANDQAIIWYQRLQSLSPTGLVHREKLDYTKSVYSRNSRHVPDALPWLKLDQVIRDVFVDTIYQGNSTAPEIVRIMASGGTRDEIIQYLKNDPALSGDRRRNEIRVRSLSK